MEIAYYWPMIGMMVEKKIAVKDLSQYLQWEKEGVLIIIEIGGTAA